ncbi:MAG: hypothetical protein ACYTFT_02875 [Planctomycetota bacterium]|jgi:hypothetical protein
MTANAKKPFQNEGERGNSLVLTVLLLTLLAGISANYVMTTVVQSKSTESGVHKELLRGVVEGAMAIALTDMDEDLEGTVVPTASKKGTIRSGILAGTRWAYILRRNTTNAKYWRVTGVANNRVRYSVAELVAERPMGAEALPPIPEAFLGALSSYYGFPDLKNIDVTGNDHLADGTRNPGRNDTVGISHKAGETTFKGGSAQLAGSGEGFDHILDKKRVDPTYMNKPYPLTPEEALGIESYPENAVFFDTLAAWDAYVADLPIDPGTGLQTVPDHSFLVLEFKTSGRKKMFGNVNWGDTEHIVIWHYPDSRINDDPDAPKGASRAPSGVHLGDWTHPFKGIAILDDWAMVNGSSFIRGTFLSLSGRPSINMQGNTVVQYSVEAGARALGKAGQVEADPGGSGDAGSGDGGAELLSYREQVVTEDSLAALADIGVTLDATAETDGGDWETATTVEP